MSDLSDCRFARSRRPATSTASQWRPRLNGDGRCFRCDGQGWVDVCGSKANPPDDGLLWGVAQACWWCVYLHAEFLATWFAETPELDAPGLPFSNILEVCRAMWQARGIGFRQPQQISLFGGAL